MGVRAGLEHHFPKRIVGVRKNGEGWSLLGEDNQGQWIYLEVATFEKGILRVRVGENEFIPEASSIIRKECLMEANEKIVERDSEICIYWGNYELCIGMDNFSFEVLDRGGECVYRENMNDVDSVGEGEDIIPPIGYSKNLEYQKTYMNIASALRMDEHIYGGGERFTEFDKRGQILKLKNKDTLGCRDGQSYKNIPFYVSSKGYGLFVNSYRIMEISVGKDSTASVWSQVEGEQLEYYLFFNKNIADIVSTFSNLTGGVTLPPKWSFGLWYSTGFKNSSEKQVFDDVKKLEANNIPVSVLHFDCYWLRENMWCDFCWEKEQYPEPEEMIRKLHAKGYKICLWINPYVTNVTEMYKEGTEKEYFVKRADGRVYEADLWHGLLPYCAIVDFTNPEACRWYQDKVRNILKGGADVLKTDFGEDIPYDAVFYNGKTGREMRNQYSEIYNCAVFQIVKEMKGDSEGLVWARSGTIGMQKYPVCWSGDPRASFEGMAATLRGGLSLAMSGVAFWSHDMGGFYGNVSEEIFIRWSQFGLFSSHSRLHGTTTRQPWAFGERALKIVRKYVGLRQQLMPYIWKTAQECAAYARPFIRPLVMQYPDDPTVPVIWDEYFWGEDILVAPIFGGDYAKRNVYLPNGQWIDVLTGKVYSGQQWHVRQCALEEMPLYIRAEKAEKIGKLLANEAKMRE